MIYDSVVKTSCSLCVSGESVMIWVLFQQDAETLSSHSTMLHGNEPISALTHALLYCCVLYIFSLEPLKCHSDIL